MAAAGSPQAAVVVEQPGPRAQVVGVGRDGGARFVEPLTQPVGALESLEVRGDQRLRPQRFKFPLEQRQSGVFAVASGGDPSPGLHWEDAIAREGGGIVLQRLLGRLKIFPLG